MNKDRALAVVLEAAQQKHDEGGIDLQVSVGTPVIGSESGLDSMALVEFCLELEDRASEFNCDFAKGSTFDFQKTKPHVGVLTECARRRKDAVRTDHPVYSLAFLGLNS